MVTRPMQLWWQLPSLDVLTAGVFVLFSGFTAVAQPTVELWKGLGGGILAFNSSGFCTVIKKTHNKTTPPLAMIYAEAG